MVTSSERIATPAERMGRVDIRAYIRRRLNEEGISSYELAKRLGVTYSNLKNGLNGSRTVPLERVETILWILDGEELLK